MFEVKQTHKPNNLELLSKYGINNKFITINDISFKYAQWIRRPSNINKYNQCSRYTYGY